MLNIKAMQVIYEDNHLIAINKKPGDLIHADETGDRTLEEDVKSYIKMRYGKPGDVWLGVLHRLDRPASGVTIFARTSKAAERMSKLFQEKKISKTYYALTDERPEPFSGTWKHYLVKDEMTNKVKAKATETKGSKLAITEYELAGEIDGQVIVKLDLITGRPHQARCQMSKMGCTIIGDIKYGSKVSLPDKSIALHCRKMQFIHPVTKESITITADFPETRLWRPFSELVEQLEKND